MSKAYALFLSRTVKRMDKCFLRLPSRLLRRLFKLFDLELVRAHAINPNVPYIFNEVSSLADIRQLTLNYVSSMRVAEGGKFLGYRHSASTNKPVLYDTLAALLLKHLYGAHDETCKEEIELVLQFQNDDGLFRDPAIACPQAETDGWWGWTHLTLHALMTLALYDVRAYKKLIYLERFDPDTFRKYLDFLDWGERVAYTSNTLQNIGVMLQYARDYQDSKDAQVLLNVLFETLDALQDPRTGLYGNHFETFQEISNGVQAGYHFWLLYFYDGRRIGYSERIIDSLLKTQNTLGGYGFRWNSSACEDIDSLDPLMRFSRSTDYRHNDIQYSLRRALPAILHNLNGDGGWVFRRNEAFTYGYSPEMYSAPNESNLFFTWFRTLGLAYCLIGLDGIIPRLQYKWNWGCAPGHQFVTFDRAG